jgi:predicted lipoprotein with Yx(FWY)xxD motif
VNNLSQGRNNLAIANVLVSGTARIAAGPKPKKGVKAMIRIALGLAAVLVAGSAYAADPAKTMDTSAGKVWADDKGMTLYTYDKDSKGAAASACVDKCIVNWPPFLAPADAKADGKWTVVDVKDKDGAMKKMWAYDGWPLYLWVKDTKPGDITGDMVGGVWHIAKPAM